MLCVYHRRLQRRENDVKSVRSFPDEFPTTQHYTTLYYTKVYLVHFFSNRTAVVDRLKHGEMPTLLSGQYMYTENCRDGLFAGLKENLKTSKPSEHPPDRWEICQNVSVGT